jgi:hypothetical protein
MSNEVDCRSGIVGGMTGYYARRRSALQLCRGGRSRTDVAFKSHGGSGVSRVRLRGQPFASGGVYPPDKSHVLK